MDGIKPVDSLEAVFPSRPPAPDKPPAALQPKGPSTFSRLLKKKSESFQDSPIPSATLAGGDVFPPTSEAIPSGLGSNVEALEILPAFDSIDKPVESEQIEAPGYELPTRPLSQPPAIAEGSLETIAGASQVIGLRPVEAIPFDDESAFDLTTSQADLEPAPVVQTPLDPHQEVEPIGEKPFSHAEKEHTNPPGPPPSLVPLELALPLGDVTNHEAATTGQSDRPLEIEPDPEVVTLSEVEPSPVAISFAQGTTAPNGVVATEENPQGHAGISWQASANPTGEAVDFVGAQTSFEVPLGTEEAQADQGAGVDSSPLPEAKEHSIPQTEAASDGPKQHSAQLIQAPTPTTNVRSASAASVTSYLPPDRVDESQVERWANRIGESIVQAANGGQVLRMRLHPPELGLLQIEVTRAQGLVTARLDMENAQAHRAILENLPQLHEMLSRSHTPIDRIELNILESRAEPESQSRQFGQSSSDRNAPGERLPSQGVFLNEDNDSRADRESLGKSRQTDDWRSRSFPISGIDIQV